VRGENRDDLHDMLIALMGKGDPYFDVDKWAHKVHAPVGSKDNRLPSKATVRLETFEVQGGGTYNKIAKDVKDPLPPPSCVST